MSWLSMWRVGLGGWCGCGWVDTATDPYTPSGGTVSHYTSWEPADEDLRPRKYEYRLPDLTA
ncbi:hypothetical protein [Streptomyces albogriseolus]|uniref:hypothetical protein n=1 Tax=Streptomyces albogriseolus TaxID=1887 RepID=UPI003F49ED05